MFRGMADRWKDSLYVHGYPPKERKYKIVLENGLTNSDVFIGVHWNLNILFRQKEANT